MKVLLRQIPIPAFLICCVCMFSTSLSHMEIARSVSRNWTFLALGFMCVWCAVSVVGNRSFVAHPKQTAKSFLLIGLIEMMVALMQFMRIIPSNNPFFRFTGTFDNPAVLGMMSAFCFSISLCLIKESAARQKKLWCVFAFFAADCVLSSSSRASILACICSAAAFLSFEDHVRSWLQKSRNRWTIASFLLLLLVAFYLWKRESADGRILMWKVSLDMIADKPLFGWGRDGFGASYMPYQAAYFLRHPDSKFLYLADNAFHPFNEYLLFTIKYGIIGLAALMACLIFMVKNILAMGGFNKILCLHLCIVLGVLSMFSYPFAIHFVWVISAYVIFYVLCDMGLRHVHRAVLIVIPMVCLAFIFVENRNIIKEWQWVKVQDRLRYADASETLAEYDKLYGSLKDNPSFLYNYAAALHYHGRYEESLKVFRECMVKCNDYNVQMLMADDYKQLGMKHEALDAFEYANRMIPCRFLPLYYEMKTCMEQGDSIRGLAIAERIVSKPVKISDAPSVMKIVREAREYLNGKTER